MTWHLKPQDNVRHTMADIIVSYYAAISGKHPADVAARLILKFCQLDTKKDTFAIIKYVKDKWGSLARAPEDLEERMHALYMFLHSPDLNATPPAVLCERVDSLTSPAARYIVLYYRQLHGRDTGLMLNRIAMRFLLNDKGVTRGRFIEATSGSTRAAMNAGDKYKEALEFALPELIARLPE